MSVAVWMLSIRSSWADIYPVSTSVPAGGESRHVCRNIYMHIKRDRVITIYKLFEKNY